MAATATIPLLFFLGSNPNHLAWGQSQEPQCKPQEPTQYDWERFNYYELLGLTGDDNDNDNHDSADNGTKKKEKKKKKKKRGSNSAGGGPSIQELGGISNKEIRKAYRKQAQKYHPDKQASKKKSSGNATNTDSKNNNNNNSNNKIRKNNNNNNSKNNNNNSIAGSLSIEESNARFAKIAEAYEFLTDETKRKDYDLFLEYCQNTEIVKDNEENEGRLSTILKKRFGGLFDDFVASRDPFRVFEEFLFGANDDDDDEWGDDNGYFDPNDPFSHLRYTNQQQPNQNSASASNDDPYHYPPPDEDPVRVFNEQRTMYDPSTGENVVRVLQTEEFAPPRKGSRPSGNPGSTRGANASSASSSSPSPSPSPSPSSFYYRIVAQDFKERYDPYSAREVYVPITEPYLQEEGQRTASGVPKHPSETSSSIRNSGSVESILHPWQVLTPSSRLMTSPNKKYVAGLSPDCELLVMRNRQEDKDDQYGNYEYGADDHDIVWSTQRAYGNNGYAANHCFAFVKGAHLVVTVGQHPHETNGMGGNSRILWHSDGRSDDHDSRHGYYEYEDEFGFWHKRQRTYLAQLDNDGALAVYSVWNVPQDQQSSSAFPSVASWVFLDAHGNRRRKPNHRNPSEATTLAADAVFRALLMAEDFFHGRIDASREYGHLYSSGTSLTYKRCVYSTSRPFGCYRLGRKVTQVSLEVYWKMRRMLLRMNHLADAWLDLIYEEDDIFYVWKESIWKNTNAFGSKMAALQARWVRKLLEKARAVSDSLASSTKQQR